MKVLLIAFLFCSFMGLAANQLPSDDDPFLTVVSGSQKKEDEPISDRLVLPAWSLSAPSSSHVLPGLLGVTLNQQGGPLVPVDLKIRGLSGSRVSIELEGLELIDPVSGLFDANDLPIFALSALHIADGPGEGHLGGKLSLSFPRVLKHFATSRFGFGSFKTGRAEAIVGVPLGSCCDAVAATQISGSAGNFSFSPTSIVTDFTSDALVERMNSDQSRWLGMVKFSERASQFTGVTVLFGKIHEGGIPGMAMAPTFGLRGRHRYLTGMQQAKLTHSNTVFEARMNGRVDLRETWQKNATQISSVAFGKADLDLNAKTFFPRAQTAMTLATSTEFTQLFNSDIKRVGAGLNVKVKTHFGSNSPLTFFSSLGFDALSDVGLLTNALFNLSYRPAEVLLTGLRLAKSARPPTFFELYAPTGVVLGNPHLRAEGSYEAEVYAHWRYKSLLNVKAGVFYGFMTEGIFYFNRNAFEIAPVNTGGVQRVGIDARIELNPYPWMGAEWTGQFLASKLISTEASLPGVPPMASNLILRLGELQGFCGWLKINHRSATASNLFGTLVAPAYVLADLFFKFPLTSSLTAHFSITNLLGNTHARDSNQFPLPGRSFFALMELST